MASYTWETVAALKAADAAYTRAWLQAVRVSLNEPIENRKAMDAYNGMMAAALRRWNAASAAAVALSEGAEF